MHSLAPFLHSYLPSLVCLHSLMYSCRPCGTKSSRGFKIKKVMGVGNGWDKGKIIMMREEGKERKKVCGCASVCGGKAEGK